MFDAQHIDGDTWLVVETDAEGVELTRHKVAVRVGGTGEDAIAAITEAQQGPTEAQLAAQARAARVIAVKSECGRRIYAVADQVAQMNMVAAVSAGRLSATQMETWLAGLQWVDDMRAACPKLIADTEAPYFATEAWPSVPGGVAELAARF